MTDQRYEYIPTLLFLFKNIFKKKKMRCLEFLVLFFPSILQIHCGLDGRVERGFSVGGEHVSVCGTSYDAWAFHLEDR